MLKVTTTHLKEGWVRRNGLPRSDSATIVEYWIRNENYLTLVTVVTRSRLPDGAVACAHRTGCSTRGCS